MLPASADVVVVGGGNAAFCAALAAAEKGAVGADARARAEGRCGGNSRFTAGAFRCVYDGVDDLKAIMPDLTEDEIARTDFGTYTQDQFYDDMFRVTQYRTDGELCDRLVGRSRDAMRWLHGKGMKFEPIWGRQAYLIDGKFKFWGGLTVESQGRRAGPGRPAPQARREERHRGALRRPRPSLDLRRRRRAGPARARQTATPARTSRASRWCSPAAASSPTPRCARATSAPAGSSPRCAARASTPATASTWRSPSAPRRFGNWSGCHAVQWDYNAPEFGDLSVGDNFQKHSYPWGILVNATGGASSTRAPTSATTPMRSTARDPAQPNNFAWQVFDGKIVPMLRDEYRIKRVTKVSANTLEEFADKLEGVDPARRSSTRSRSTTRR